VFTVWIFLVFTVPAWAFTLFRFSRSSDSCVRLGPIWVFDVVRDPQSPLRGYSEGDVWPPACTSPGRHCANGPPRARGHGRASSGICRQDIEDLQGLGARSRSIGRS